MGFSVDSKLKDLLADERAREVLRKHFPESANDPRINMVMYYSLRAIASFPEAGITSDKLKALDEDLKKL